MIQRDTLVDALALAARFTRTNSGGLPVLGMVLMRPNAICASNLEQHVQVTVNTGLNTEIVVPAKRFLGWARHIPAGPIEIANKGGVLYLESGNYKATLPTVSADEFPLVHPVTGTAFRFDPALADSVLYAVAKEETRPALAGVYCDAHDGWIHLSAANGYVLAQVKAPCGDYTGSFLLPADTLRLLRHISDEPVMATVDDQHNTVQFDGARGIVTSQLIEAVFPNVTAVIPTNEPVASCQVTGLKEALLALTPLVPDVNLVLLELAENCLTLSTQGNDGITGQVRVPTMYSGVPAKIALALPYLLNVANKSEAVTLEFRGETVLFVARANDNEFDGIMPMHITK